MSSEPSTASGDPDDGELAFLDEHTRLVRAPAADVWPALVARLAAGGSASARAYAALVGADPGRAAGRFPDSGSALPGFGVEIADPPRRLRLTGRHRFSRYRLAFVLEPQDGATLVRPAATPPSPDRTGACTARPSLGPAPMSSCCAGCSSKSTVVLTRKQRVRLAGKYRSWGLSPYRRTRATPSTGRTVSYPPCTSGNGERSLTAGLVTTKFRFVLHREASRSDR